MPVKFSDKDKEITIEGVVEKASKKVKKTGGVGRQSLYDPHVHPQMLIDVFNEEKPSAAKFCVRAGISKSTFQNRWLKAHEEFADAYEYAKTLAEAQTVDVTWDNATGATKGNAVAMQCLINAHCGEEYRAATAGSTTVNIGNMANFYDMPIEDLVSRFDRLKTELLNIQKIEALNLEKK